VSETTGFPELDTRVRALEKLLDERDRWYQERFNSQKEAIATALQGAKELTAAAAIASKEAITKQEMAQASYNTTHNDLTRKMDAQYKEMIPRPEADSKFRSLDEKIEEIKKEITGLRESRSLQTGHQEQRIETRGTVQWGVSVGLATAGMFLGLAYFITNLLIRFMPLIKP
jgi:wobble nucleotide-excising tRNase